jgi:aryl-alcohol dehydrogenase-like predicted oxidoreductase
MRERRLGDFGPVVSAVGLGCNNFGWRIDAEQSGRVVAAALDAGITLFDTAESYGGGDSERFLGRALAGRREEVVVATKFRSGSAEDVRRSIDGSLERLGTDYVDVYQYHRHDGVTPVEETLGALDELVRAGKARYTGSSNFSAAQVWEADALARERALSPFVCAQNEYSLLLRDAEAELVPVLEELGLGLLPYFPLASGLLTGKYRRGEPAPEGTRLADRAESPDAETWDRVEALAAFGEARGISLLDVAIGGLAAMPAVSSVIAGATSPEQVRANAAAGEWVPSLEELAELRG